MDKLTRGLRSHNMGRIGSKDTRPEMLVRRLVHALGYRYRLHVKELPGKPDLVFRSRKKVIFVHGCFWHQHKGCREGRVPSSSESYWAPKLARNVERDGEHLRSLKRLGWKVLVLWECQLDSVARLERKVRAFLGSMAV
jgi:DNA mismatch endonuclease (patch repair protein)